MHSDANPPPCAVAKVVALRNIRVGGVLGGAEVVIEEALRLEFIWLGVSFRVIMDSIPADLIMMTVSFGIKYPLYSSSSVTI